MSVNLAFGRLRQVDRDFRASLGYMARPCLKITKTKIGNRPNVHR
jgi:hypothetical protein